MSDETPIAGTIRPSYGGGPPIFKIVRHESDLRDAGPNVRPCPHGEYVLDTQFMTVTCGLCHQRVEPFAALLTYAEWGERWRNQAAFAEQAERTLHMAFLRKLRDLRITTPARRAEIVAVLENPYRVRIDELQRLTSAIEKENNKAINERLASRRT